MPYLTSDERYASQASPAKAKCKSRMPILGIALLVFMGTWLTCHVLLVIMAIPLIIGQKMSQLGLILEIGALIGTRSLVNGIICNRLVIVKVVCSACVLGAFVAYATLF